MIQDVKEQYTSELEKPKIEMIKLIKEWYKCCPVCESPTQQLWDLILLWLLPSYHLIVASPLSLDVEYLFWNSSSVFVDFHVETFEDYSPVIL